MKDKPRDYLLVWMALITERERLKEIVATKRGPRGPMTDEEVANVEVERVSELVDLVFERRDKLDELLAGKPPTVDEKARELVEEMKAKLGLV